MNKSVTTPAAAKAVTATTPVAAKTAAPEPVVALTTPIATADSAPAVVIEPKKIDMNKQSIKDAIAKGKILIKEGKSKADAAMVIFEALKDEEKEVVIASFVQGATLTDKGAVTYFYNCRRKSKKATKVS